MVEEDNWFRSEVQKDEFGNDFVAIGPYDLSEYENKEHFYEDTICEVYGSVQDPVDTANKIVVSVNFHDRLVSQLEYFLIGLDMGWDKEQFTIEAKKLLKEVKETEKNLEEFA